VTTVSEVYFTGWYWNNDSKRWKN